MNPYKLKEVYKYLTRAKKADPSLPDVFSASKAPIPAKTQNVQEIEAINRFNKDNPRIEKAGGGMLVQPSNDGSRPGYDGRGGARPNTGGDRSEFIDYEARIKNPGKKKLDLAEKVHGNKPEYKGLKGFELWKKLKQFERSNIRQGSTTGGTGGIGKLKKNQIGKDDFIKLVNQNKNKTYNEFVELIKNFKTKDGQPFTKNIIADRLRQYNLSGSFKKEPPKGMDLTKKAEAEIKRKVNLSETDPTGAKGTKKFQFHHIRQIAGGIPLTSDDVVIINGSMNRAMQDYDKSLNRISSAIRKNNKLALEAMNAKDEGAALKYMTRVDELNSQAEKIVNSAIDKLPKKYKNLIGFNQFTLPSNEYGLPIGNEPMIIKKVGGMPVSEDAIDLTTLTKKDQAKFKKIVRDQAERGEVGPIKLTSVDKKILNNIQSYSKLSQCKVGAADGGRIGFAFSDECIRDGLKEQKIAAQNGNKKAARELVQVGKVATRAGLLKNILGPGAILGEAIYEGAVIGNKVLGGTPKDIAWAESYLSYLDPRKYTPEGLDPLEMRREDMVTRTINDQTIDGPNANLLRSGFAAQDQVSAFNEAVNEKLRGETAGRLDIANKAAADIREQSKFVNPAKDIISSEAFKDATNVAQEYLQGQSGQQQADFGVFSVPQSTMADEGRSVRAMSEMRKLNPLKSDQELLKLLEKYNIDPKDYDYTYTPRNFPADTSSKSVTGFDNLRDFYQQEQATQNIAYAGGVANLAGGGIAKMAGIDQGPPPVKGPNSQGLQGLLKRGIKI